MKQILLISLLTSFFVQNIAMSAPSKKRNFNIENVKQKIRQKERQAVLRLLHRYRLAKPHSEIFCSNGNYGRSRTLSETKTLIKKLREEERKKYKALYLAFHPSRAKIVSFDGPAKSWPGVREVNEFGFVKRVDLIRMATPPEHRDLQVLLIEFIKSSFLEMEIR